MTLGQEVAMVGIHSKIICFLAFCVTCYSCDSLVSRTNSLPDSLISSANCVPLTSAPRNPKGVMSVKITHDDTVVLLQ